MEKEKVDWLMEESEKVYHKHMAGISLDKQKKKEWIKQRFDKLLGTMEPDDLDNYIASLYAQMEHDIELAIDYERKELKKRSIAILDLLAVEHSEIDPCWLINPKNHSYQPTTLLTVSASHEAPRGKRLQAPPEDLVKSTRCSRSDCFR